MTTPSAKADGFSGNARPTGPRFLPKAESPPQNFQGRGMITTDRQTALRALVPTLAQALGHGRPAGLVVFEICKHCFQFGQCRIPFYIIAAPANDTCICKSISEGIILAVQRRRMTTVVPSSARRVIQLNAATSTDLGRCGHQDITQGKVRTKPGFSSPPKCASNEISQSVSAIGVVRFGVSRVVCPSRKRVPIVFLSLMNGNHMGRSVKSIRGTLLIRIGFSPPGIGCTKLLPMRLSVKSASSQLFFFCKHAFLQSPVFEGFMEQRNPSVPDFATRYNDETGNGRLVSSIPEKEASGDSSAS